MNNATTAPVRGFHLLKAKSFPRNDAAATPQPPAAGAAPAPVNLATLTVPERGVAAVRELPGENGAPPARALFMDLTSGEQISFASRQAFVEWAAKASLPTGVVDAVLEIGEAEGAIAPADTSGLFLDPEWALEADQFHVSETWEFMSEEDRAAKATNAMAGVPIALPLDAPNTLRLAAGLEDTTHVVIDERLQRKSVELHSLPSAYAFMDNGILRVREPNRQYARTSFGGPEGFARWALALDVSAQDQQRVHQFAQACVDGWVAMKPRLRQAGLDDMPAAGAQLGERSTKESTMTATTNAPADKAATEKQSPVLRAVERNKDTGEYVTTILLFAVKGDSKVMLSGQAFGEHVAGFINAKKDGGRVFATLSKTVDGKHETVGHGNAINAYKDGSPCYFDTVAFNVGGKTAYARVTNAMDETMHQALGFTSPRVPRPAKPAPAEAATEVAEEAEGGPAPRG